MAPWRAGRRAATKKERYHGFRDDQKRNRFTALRGRRRTLGGGPAQGRRRGRRVLLLRADHRRLLPPLVPTPARAQRTRPLHAARERRRPARVPSGSSPPPER